MSQVVWKQGLCNCCGDCSVCMCGTCCEPCLVYRNADSLGKSGLLCCILGCFFPCVPALLLRSEARERYNIEVSESNNNDDDDVIDDVDDNREAPWETQLRGSVVLSASSARWEQKSRREEMLEALKEGDENLCKISLSFLHKIIYFQHLYLHFSCVIYLKYL